MAIDRYSGTVAENAANATTLNVPYPSPPGGILSTDVLVLTTFINNLNPATNPSGYTLGIEAAAGAASPTTAVRYKQAAGGESGNLAVTTPSATSRGQLHVLRGVDLTTPLAAAATEIERSAANNAFTIPAQTMPVTDCLLMYGGAANAATGTFTPPTVPTAFTELWDDTSPTPHATTGVLLWTGSGSTGAVNLVRVGTAVRGAAWLIAFRPAAGVTNVDGTAAVAGTGTISSSGTVGTAGSASVAGTGTHSATGVVGKLGAVAVAGVVAVTGTGVVGRSSGAAVDGTGTIAATGVVGKAGSADVEGTGTIDAAGSVGTGSGVDVEGTGTITADGTVGTADGLSVEGTGTVEAGGTVGTATGLTLVGVGEITAAGIVGEVGSGTLDLTGLGTVDLVGRVDSAAAIELVGVGTITAAGEVAGAAGPLRDLVFEGFEERQRSVTFDEHTRRASYAQTQRRVTYDEEARTVSHDEEQRRVTFEEES